MGDGLQITHHASQITHYGLWVMSKEMTRWNWMCQYHENLKLGKNTDIGASTYVNAETALKYGNMEVR